MTIGIAASGPGAARAILDALAKVEGIASGAVGGFISFACIGDEGLWRCGRQRGGARSLLAEGLPPAFGDAALAVLMSSGPDRPEPLAQFTPGDAAVGLITGHRFPNSPGPDGSSLAEAALTLMRQGSTPASAAQAVAADHPDADAGFICLGVDGSIGVANTAYVAGFPGLGRSCRDRGGARVAVLCNAITHGHIFADLIAEMALLSMQPAVEVREVTLRAGLPVRRAARAELKLDPALRPLELSLPSLPGQGGMRNGGYGPEAVVTLDGQMLGHLLYEPFLTFRDGRVETFDGKDSLTVAYAPPPGPDL